MNHYETCGICHTAGPCQHKPGLASTVFGPPMDEGADREIATLRARVVELEGALRRLIEEHRWAPSCVNANDIVAARRVLGGGK